MCYLQICTICCNIIAMNILLVVSHLRRGGPVDVVYNICRNLIKTTNVSILTLRKEGNNSKIADFRDLGISVTQLNLSYLTCEIFKSIVTRKISRLITDKKIDIVHCHGYHPVIACARLQNVKKITTLHNRANEDYINSFGPIIGRYMLWRYLGALKSFDANVAVSSSAVTLYQTQGVPNVINVNNGINTSIYSIADSNKRNEIRNRLGLPLSGQIIISSGRIEPEKRCEALVSWFTSYVSDLNIYLVVLGDGSRLESCKKITSQDARVLYTGRVSNVYEYLQCADYYISNSKSEGMSMAVCEGIGCGLTPILSNIPSHRDVAEYIGGYLFDNVDKINIKEAMAHKHTPQELHNYIRDNFSIDTMSEGYYNIYKCLINE